MLRQELLVSPPLAAIAVLPLALVAILILHISAIAEVIAPNTKGYC